MKIAREDKLSAGNRSVVNKFEPGLKQDITSLCNTLAASISHQNEQLQCIDKLCHTFINLNDKAIIDLRRKVAGSRALYVSHIEELQNVVLLHKANTNASFEELLGEEAADGISIFNELQGYLSTQQGEMAHFARELRQRFNVSVGHTSDISKTIKELFNKLMEESNELGSHATLVDQIQTKNIDEFQKAYEEHSKSDAEKLIADVASLVSNHICRQKEMVDALLASIRETATGSKKVLDGHVLSLEYITSDAKRKWQDFSMQAENDAKENADLAAAKHCRFESLMQKCVDATESALNHSKKTHNSVVEMGRNHVTAVDSLVRGASDSNEHHDREISSLRETAEGDVLKTSKDISKHMDGTSEQETEVISAILQTTKSQAKDLESLHEDHSRQSASIEQKAWDTFHQKYMDYEPSGNTPLRKDTDIPSKVTIDSLRAMPVESLSEEFRENHSFESFAGKESKITSAPRPALAQIN